MEDSLGQEGSLEIWEVQIERSRVFNSHSESCKSGDGSAVVGHSQKGSAERVPYYILVNISLNATTSTVGYQHLSWIMRHIGITYYRITVPKSAKKL